MNPYVYLAALVLSLSIGAGGYAKGRHDEAADAIERERNGLLAYAEQIKQGVEQDDQNKITIRGLRADVERMRDTVRFPVCAADTDEAGRVLSERVDSLFGVLQERVGRLVEEADTINADAIRQNALR